MKTLMEASVKTPEKKKHKQLRLYWLSKFCKDLYDEVLKCQDELDSDNIQIDDRFIKIGIVEDEAGEAVGMGLKMFQKEKINATGAQE